MNNTKTLENSYNYAKLCETVRRELPDFVNEKRLSHTSAVSELASFIAKSLNSSNIREVVCEKKAELAALLHDITKCMNQSELCKKYGIILTQDDLNSPQTLHAITGAYFSRERYNIDNEVFSAIANHTVGNLKMSLLDKIIFVSDYCEVTRKPEECQNSRHLLLNLLKDSDSYPPSIAENRKIYALDYVYAEILGKTLVYLKETGKYVHSSTYNSFNAIIKQYSNDEAFKKLATDYGVF